MTNWKKRFKKKIKNPPKPVNVDSGDDYVTIPTLASGGIKCDPSIAMLENFVWGDDNDEDLIALPLYSIDRGTNLGESIEVVWIAENTIRNNIIDNNPTMHEYMDRFFVGSSSYIEYNTVADIVHCYRIFREFMELLPVKTDDLTYGEFEVSFNKNTIKKWDRLHILMMGYHSFESFIISLLHHYSIHSLSLSFPIQFRFLFEFLKNLKHNFEKYKTIFRDSNKFYKYIIKKSLKDEMESWFKTNIISSPQEYSFYVNKPEIYNDYWYTFDQIQLTEDLFFFK